MSNRQTSETLAAREEIADSPTARACTDQNFELPSGIFIAMAFLFAGTVAVLSLALPGHMGVSFAVIFAFLAAFFVIPAIFVASAPGTSGAVRWSEFMRKGIKTGSGHSSGGSAALLVLMLPFLIFCFAVVIATIVALT
ncbi:MAG TPA: hypothetical protein VFM42_00300 [Sphingomicrobium sp.]|jgi:hypothetical protein|nr:hypothetical protein [Sphingomicrobium sp.]